MGSNNNKRIREQDLPGNYYDGEILYGSEMNKIVDILREGVNANKEDIDNLILDVEKHASVINLGIIDLSELDDVLDNISQIGIYKYSVRLPDEAVNNYLLFQTFDGLGSYIQTIYNGYFIQVRSGINDNWNDWEYINLLAINSNTAEIHNIQDNLDLVENKVNKNTDDISALNSSLSVIDTKVDNNIVETNKKLDKETYQAQEVNSKVNFRGGIETDVISSPGSLVIDSHTLFGIDADKKVFAGEYYEGIVYSDDNRLATRKYVADKFAELVGNSPEALDTIYELAEALQNNPDIINELLIELSNLQNNKVDKTTKINGKELSSDITLTKADIGLSNVDNTSDLDKPISTAVQIALDKKANNADLAPILNLENIGFFEKYGNIVETTTEDFILGYLQNRVFYDLGFQTPIRIGIRHKYGVDKYFILTDSPIQDFEGIVEYYETIYADYAYQTHAKITIWERDFKASERQNAKQYVKIFRDDFTTDWESIAYESDIEKVEQELSNEISEVDAKVDNNIVETNKKLDKETTQEQEVRSTVYFQRGIATDHITSFVSNSLTLFIDNTYFGSNADRKVYAGEYYEGLMPSDDNRLATRKYVADKFAELVGNSPEALDTIYELAEALQNNPDIINELLIEQYNLQNNKVDKTTKINGKALVSDINLTKADIGLSNVDNTSDLDKPVSTAVQIELDKKANKDDLESEVARLDNEISEVDAKSTENKNTIDKIISGRQTVGKALTAINLTSQERHPIEDLFSTRITAKYENEIISSIDEETTAVIDEIGGFSVKQLVRNNNFETNSDWEAAGNATNLVIANNEGSYIGGANGFSALWQVYELPIKNGDKYYISAEIMPPSDIASGTASNLIGFRYTNAGLNGIRVESISSWSAKANVWNKISGIITINFYQQGVEPIYFTLQTYETAGLIKWRKPVLINLTELGLDHLTVEQVEYLLGNRHYPFGITNAKPSKLISVGENLFDWREFYDTLKAVNPNNVEIVNKDGRECIKITNPTYYKGIELYKGKFAPNVRYRLIAEGFHETNQNLSLRYVYTDSTYSNAFHIPSANTEEWHVSDRTSLEGKTIDYITIYLNYNYPTYININKLQLQMLDNPETEFIPYSENEVKLPTAYEDYGMPSLPNGVRDRIFRIGNSPDNSEWFYEKNVGKITVDSSMDWIFYSPQPATTVATFLLDVGITHIEHTETGNAISSLFPQGNHYGEEYERFSLRTNGYLYINVKKFRIPGWDDNWTSEQKVNAFKQWLQNPITIYYQLEEPQLTRIDDWNSQYLAYNYGREEIVDSEGNTTPTYTVIKYYPDYVKQTQTNSEILQTQKQDKLIAGDNITIDPTTNVISASVKEFYRVRMFDESNNLIATQILYAGEKVQPLDRPGNTFYFGTRDPFDYDTVITDDLDLTYVTIPSRYVQTTVEDFDENGDYIGMYEYIILPKDKPSGYRIQNVNVKGVATSGNYLTDASNMFNGNNSLYLELDYLDTSNVTNMYSMFANSKATTLDLRSFDTSNVTNMSDMFYNSQATTLDLSSFNTSNVTNMYSMFANSKATTLDLSSFDTSNVTNMGSMFSNSQATTLDLSNFDTSNVTNMSYMFRNSKATTLDLSSFDTSNVQYMSNMFQNAQATIGYARTQADADKFNSSSDKPETLTFVVK